MSVCFQLVDVRGFGGSVVAGENDQGVVGQPVAFQCFRYFDDDMVGLHHEIGVRANATFALPLGTRHNGVVWGSQWDIKEEGFLFACPRLDILDRLLGEPGQHVDFIVVFDDTIVLNDRFHISRMMKAVIEIETPSQWSVWNL